MKQSSDKWKTQTAQEVARFTKQQSKYVGDPILDAQAVSRAKPVFTVLLCHSPNPDIRGGDVPGYWIDPECKGRKTLMTVNSLSEAAAVCRAYIIRRGLGGGNWTGGEVRDGNDVLVGHVAYNGRVFAPAAPGKAAWEHGDCIWEKI